MRVAPDLAETVRDHLWWHSIDLGNGIVTPGHKTAAILAAEADVVFREAVDGLTVIDVGAWDGFFSFEAKKRGASRVLATDHFAWSGDGWGKKASFDCARAALAVEVNDCDIDIPAIAPTTVGMFDVGLLLGVFYHLKEPFAALERVAAVVTERIIVETHLSALDDDGPPTMLFYPGSSLQGDPTNWWGPTRTCVEAMLRECGFVSVDFTPHPLCSDRGFFHAHR